MGAVSHVWVSSRVSDAYYHFIVTRGMATYPRVRVAFSLSSRESGHISSRIDYGGNAMVEDVDSRAQWYLDPEAFAAWSAQRTLGYLGDLESMGAESFDPCHECGEIAHEHWCSQPGSDEVP